MCGIGGVWHRSRQVCWSRLLVEYATSVLLPQAAAAHALLSFSTRSAVMHVR